MTWTGNRNRQRETGVLPSISTFVCWPPQRLAAVCQKNASLPTSRHVCCCRPWNASASASSSSSSLTKEYSSILPFNFPFREEVIIYIALIGFHPTFRASEAMFFPSLVQPSSIKTLQLHPLSHHHATLRSTPNHINLVSCLLGYTSCCIHNSPLYR